MEVVVAEDGLHSCGVVIDNAATGNSFSDEDSMAEIWFLLGSERRIKPNSRYAVVHLVHKIVTEI